jgi:hypothetical protein
MSSQSDVSTDNTNAVILAHFVSNDRAGQARNGFGKLQ